MSIRPQGDVTTFLIIVSASHSRPGYGESAFTEISASVSACLSRFPRGLRLRPPTIIAHDAYAIDEAPTRLRPRFIMPRCDGITPYDAAISCAKAARRRRAGAIICWGLVTIYLPAGSATILATGPELMARD